MKLVLMGTPEFVVPIFDAIYNAGHEIMAVFTRGAKPVGRKHILTKSPVHLWAESKGIPVYNRASEYNFSPDMVVVVSYGVILRDNVLSSAPCVNIHPSDLPKYRGPSPIKTAIYNGDAHSAVCLMQIAPELDSGDILMRRGFEIGENETNDDIESRVSKIGAEMLTEYLAAPANFAPAPQIGTPIFTHKWSGANEIIDWSRGARNIHNQIRALGAGRTKINGIDVKILQTRIASNGDLEILQIQPAGKRPMDWQSFKNGLRGGQIKIGE